MNTADDQAGSDDRRIFHIADAGAAARLDRDGELRPESLAGEGFVHLSTARQVVASTERHFEADADLILLELDPDRVVDEVRWPEVYPGERFPHLHGPIRREALVAVHRWMADDRAEWSD